MMPRVRIRCTDPEYQMCAEIFNHQSIKFEKNNGYRKAIQIKKKLHADRALLAVSKDVSNCGGKVVARIHMTNLDS